LRMIESGLDVMAVSLAGATPATHERFRPGCDLAQIDGALTRLRELKRDRGARIPHVHIAFMLLRSNWREVERLVDLAARWGAAQVVVSNLTWIGTAALRDESILERRDLWPEVAALMERTRRDASGKGIDFCYRDPETWHPRPACTENVLKACFVSYRGDVSPCVFTGLSGSSGDSAIHYFDGRAHKAGRLVFGNVREDTLPAIWNSAKARAFRGSFADRQATGSLETSGLPEPCRHCYKLLEQ